jgi:DHA1 family inner membrane transport protein
MMALLSLAIGSFGIGMTEFVVMGLLPNIAQDLLPSQWAASP